MLNPFMAPTKQEALSCMESRALSIFYRFMLSSSLTVMTYFVF